MSAASHAAAARRRRYRRHVHRSRVRAARRTARPAQAAVHAGRLFAGDRRGHRRILRGGEAFRQRRQRSRARDHRGHQRDSRTPGRAHRAHHHRGLPRRARAAPHPHSARLRPGLEEAGAAGRARAAAGRARAAGRAGRRARRRSTWTMSMRRSTSCRRRASRRWPCASCTLIATPATSARSARGCASGCRGVHVSLSSDVLPEMLEFERTSTTVVNAYIAPLIARYLDRLRGALAERDVRAPILVMQSNGGFISASSAAARPVTIIESGPAAGVVAAQRIARACGYPNVITLDMGGTTTKASIIERGEILRGTEYEVGVRGVGQQPADARQRIPAAHSGDRHLRGRRRRRQHRGARCGRLAARGPAQRRRGAGPRLLRSRQRAADGHRCQSAPRLHQRHVARGRRADGRPRAGRGGGAAST